MRGAIICMAIAGCATGDLIPQGGGAISLTRIDAQGGQRTDVIYSNDILQTTRLGRASRSSMPVGSYGQARNNVEAARIIVPAQRCTPDLVGGVIRVTPPTSAGATTLTNCNIADFAKTRAAIARLLPPWPTPTVAQVAAR